MFKIIGRLHPHQCLRLDAECVFELRSHIGRQRRLAVEQVAQRYSSHLQMRGSGGHGYAMGLYAIVLEPRTGVTPYG